jgi:hypothetical protein
MGLIFGGVNFEFEKKLAKKNALVSTIGYYPYGLFKGNARLGLDAKQYLGASQLPKGLFVSLGSLFNFKLADYADSGFLNSRALVGYQTLSNHVTFEIAAGPQYAFYINSFQNTEENQKVGLLPVLKLSIGYAF